jgi:hypothetical protein
MVVMILLQVSWLSSSLFFPAPCSPSSIEATLRPMI